MILNITYTFVILIIILYVTYIILKKEQDNKISFKESMDLVELPVITFYNNNVKLNFLLDTGSNLSHINKSILNKLDYKEVDCITNVIGVGGMKECGLCEMSVKYKNQIFKEDFYITDLDEAFDTVKKESGVQIHGILGNKFFNKYRYILDFDKLVAYSR